jgi:kynurenine formamidase
MSVKSNGDFRGNREGSRGVTNEDSNVIEMFGRRIQILDLSDTISNHTSAFEKNPQSIRYFAHEDTAKMSADIFGIGSDYWRNGQAWAYEIATLSTHSGTHIDAPYHYAPQSGGSAARTVEQLPLNWLIGDGVVLNMIDADRKAGIGARDIEIALDRIDYRLKPRDIVLIRTDASKFFDEPGYDYKHAGLRAEATRFLVERGVRLIGIDAWGLDRSFDIMIEEAKSGDRYQLWESHYFGAEQEYCQIEKLANLDSLPRAHGFSVLALPVKVANASAGWSRVVALVPLD